VSPLVSWEGFPILMPTFEDCPIAITTDFGADSAYVGVMRGVILSINPKATIVDHTHSVPSYDVLAGAVLLRQSYHYFPSSIHLVVIDPGVGSSRRPLLLITEKYAFVGPDNGLFTPICESEKPWVIELNQERFFRSPVSRTFHGRDIFAPVAAHLSLGVAPETLGRQIVDMVTLEIPTPRVVEGSVAGTILRVDKFGNLVTNMTPATLGEARISRDDLVMRIGDQVVQKWVESYAEADPGVAIILLGSSGLLEISVNQGSAAELLRASAYEAVFAYRKPG